MNSTDIFIQLAMKPLPKLSLSAEIHRLQLTESADFWYAGGGVFEEGTFGFASRPSNGHDSLALVADLNVEYALAPRTTLTFYLAGARGGDVIDSIYAGRSGMMAYVEILQRF